MTIKKEFEILKKRHKLSELKLKRYRGVKNDLGLYCWDEDSLENRNIKLKSFAYNSKNILVLLHEIGHAKQHVENRFITNDQWELAEIDATLFAYKEYYKHYFDENPIEKAFCFVPFKAKGVEFFSMAKNIVLKQGDKKLKTYLNDVIFEISNKLIGKHIVELFFNLGKPDEVNNDQLKYAECVLTIDRVKEILIAS